VARISFSDPAKLTHPGSGLDYQAPTLLDDGQVLSAAEALEHGPASQAMCAYAHELVGYLNASGAKAADVVADYRAGSDRPGGLMVRWGGEPSAHRLAELLGPIPCWIQLRPDDDFDVRYGPADGS
jgi:hypothetical protein